MDAHRWLATMLSVLLVGCTGARTTGVAPPTVRPAAPVAQERFNCELAQEAVLYSRHRWAQSPLGQSVQDQLIALQGSDANLRLELVQPRPDAAGHCIVRWTGDAGGAPVQLTWWYTATGDVQAADTSTKSTLGW